MLKDKYSQFVANTYNRFPVEIVSGKGAVFQGRDGKEYIDMTSGIGVNAFGCADDAWLAAIAAQAAKVQHTSNLYYTEPGAELAELLCRRTGMKKVFFCNSGAEANEGAIKTARKYGACKKGADYYTVITLTNSFHGRTITTLAATGQEHYHELFQPLTPGFVDVPANDIAAMEDAVKKYKVAGIFFECIQGEGGVLPLDTEYVRQLAQLAAREDILLMVDEVQTGNGRTGKLYSYMNYGIQPDVVTTAKGLGGGLPIGAVMFGEKTEDTLQPGEHASTFGGNPVCCAGAISIVSRMTDDFLAGVAAKGEYVAKRLLAMPGVLGVTGMGLMIGIKTEKPASDVVKTCMANGLLCITAKDKVRLLPPLNISQEQLDKALDIIAAAL